ncbi:MAG: 4Fe-4S dicluster domain-containing protein [Nitrospinae bacterium]|nr:4Fe-4S dicluster domain-containing protein [Nitrospinota bacterium]
MSSKIEYDVLLVGASPSNLTLALRLVELASAPIRICILEKAKAVGGHLLSGAVSNPRTLKKIFPDWDKGEFPLAGICKNSYLTVLGAKRHENVPYAFMPSYFKKEGYAILNISEMAAYMADKLQERAKEKEGVVVDIFPGFPAQSILFEGDRVVGVKVDNTGDPLADNCYAKVTVFGDKGFVSRDLINKFNLRKNGQTYAVGVKEVWECQKSYEGEVWHTTGYPLAAGHLGGGFVYGCKDNKLIIGLVMSLDFPDPNLRPPLALQDYKKHPFIQEMIKGGKLLKYGASILPEGGQYGLPERFAVDGALMVGDALGTLDVKKFSGVDKAMESGYVAAEVVWEAMKKNDTSATALAPYQQRLMSGWVGKELSEARYFRRAFAEYPQMLGWFMPTLQSNIDSGMGVMTAGFMTGLSNPFGALKLLGAKNMIENPGEAGSWSYKKDYTHIVPEFTPKKELSTGYDDGTVYSTADVVFYAHTHYEEDNKHIDEFNADTCMKCIAQYDRHGKDTPCVGDCTAEVHQTIEKDGKRRHAMALENCVQCTTCEIVCPWENLRVNAAQHGYGPDFMGM